MEHLIEASEYIKEGRLTALLAKGAWEMAHLKAPISSYIDKPCFIATKGKSALGVPNDNRLITKSMFTRRFADIREFSDHTLGLAARDREVLLMMLRLYAHHGKVYIKAETVARECGISKRTYWRIMGNLIGEGLVEVVNQYNRRREGYQINNFYRLDKVVLVLAHRLAEIGQALSDRAHKIFRQFDNFWTEIWQTDVDINLAFEAPVKRKFI